MVAGILYIMQDGKNKHLNEIEKSIIHPLDDR